ncbi:hypothetical protein AAMO2058_001362900 [Amorphochlora amoebiformis]
MSLFRGLVSKKKLRYQQDGFDLDLSYVKKNIIAMGFPSEGGEALYRNPMSEVQRFFKEKHDGHYKIYNLCAEKTYEPEKFNHNTAWYPFEDHNAAPMQTIEDICKDLHKYLNNDKKNVAAIHCKAGKGRSGLIIACYLLYSGECHTAEEALVVFAAKRTSDGKGVTIPSQKRFVSYFENYLKMEGKRREALDLRTGTKRELIHVRFWGVPNFDVGGGCDPYFKVLKYEKDGNLKKVFNSRSQHKVRKYKKGKNFIDIQCCVPLEGDCKLVFMDADTLNADDEMFWLWIHTSFTGEKVFLRKKELDGAHKENKKSFDKDFTCTLFFNGANLPEITNSTTRMSVSAVQRKQDSNKKSILNIRSLVSKKKIRFVQGKYDLDLTYIKDTIIAMGFPSTGTESLYRNPLNMVQDFFQEFHPGRFKIYNLCSEKTYDSKLFGGSHCCGYFPFHDHNACALENIIKFCEDAKLYLDKLPENVISVHCKAGKGRTGTMIASLLLYLGEFETAKESLAYFGEMRTQDGKGVTIPSQKRYVNYYAAYLKGLNERKMLNFKGSRVIKSISVDMFPTQNRKAQPYFLLMDSDLKIQYDSRQSGSKPPTIVVKDYINCSWPLDLKAVGDCKFVFYDDLQSKNKVFWCWLCMPLEKGSMVTLTKAELDGACKKKVSMGFEEGLKCRFNFSHVERKENKKVPF